MTIVELLGVAPYGQGMARALLLPVVFASANLLAAARLGSDYRPASAPARAPIGGIAIGPIVVRELVKVFAGQAPGGPRKGNGSLRGVVFFAREKPTCYKLCSTEQDSRH